MERRLEEHEMRIRHLEESNIESQITMSHLMKRMDSLMAWIKTLVITTIPVIIGILGFLISFWVKN